MKSSGARTHGFHSLKGLGRHLGIPPDRLEAAASTAGRYYRPFDRRRTAGTGAWRHIDRPTGELVHLQRRIHARLLRGIELPDYITGVNGRSTKHNAGFHVGKPTVVTLDLYNCYPQIDHRQVFAAWKDDLGFGRETASLLTKLTTFQGRLPQGAPTSPMLANVVLRTMYAEIAELAAQTGIDVSFYVDDITVSGAGAEDALTGIINIIHAHGRRLSRDKIRVSRSHAGPQIVTGIVTNTKLSVGMMRIRSIRKEILSLSHEPDIAHRAIQRVNGLIADVRYVNADQAEALERLARSCLPEHGVGGDRPRSDEVRDCTRTRRHRGRRESRERGPAAASPAEPAPTPRQRIVA